MPSISASVTSPNISVTGKPRASSASPSTSWRTRSGRSRASVSVTTSATVSVTAVFSVCMARNSARISSRICDMSVAVLIPGGVCGENCARACCTRAEGEQCHCRTRSFRRSSSSLVSQMVTALRPCWRFSCRQRCTRLVSDMGPAPLCGVLLRCYRGVTAILYLWAGAGKRRPALL
jgi:hypothetical protein